VGIADELERLARLRESGALTRQEYEAAKAQALRSASFVPPAPDAVLSGRFPDEHRSIPSSVRPSRDILPTATAIGAPAEWWQRVLAALIDVLVIVAFIGMAVGVGYWSESREGFLNLIAPAAVAFAFIVQPVYFIGHHAVLGQTIGKAIMHTHVADELTGDPIGFGRAFLRWLAPMVLTAALYIPGLLNLLWPLWDRQHQTLHDKAVKSLVLVGEPKAGNLFDLLKKHGGYNATLSALDGNGAGNKGTPSTSGTVGANALRVVTIGIPLLAAALYGGFADRRPEPPGQCFYSSRERENSALNCYHEDIHNQPVRKWLWDHDYNPNGFDFPHPPGVFDHNSHEYEPGE
jgi:uncharacterized RDD family membrane protein YckC